MLSVSEKYVGRRVKSIKAGSFPSFRGVIIGTQNAFYVVKNTKDNTEWLRYPSELEIYKK
jgi:hypothetical protein